MDWIVVFLVILGACWIVIGLVVRRRGEPPRRAHPPTHAAPRPTRRAPAAASHDGHSGGSPVLSTVRSSVRRSARPLLPRRPTDCDPFEALALQCRLTALATEIRQLESDPSTLALAHHLRATQYAYDALLSQACQMVGLPGGRATEVPVTEVTSTWTVDEDVRMRHELELCSRGWSW